MSKTALITGAAGGLGRALALEFARAGYGLILGCRGQEEFACGTVVRGDLRDRPTLLRLARAATEQDVDVLVNCAGIYSCHLLEAMTLEEMEQVLAVDLVAPMLLTRLLWPTFERKREGTVVNVNSLASRSPSRGETAYAAAKAGLAGFSRALQHEASAVGVRVLDVTLGAMRTPMTEWREDREKMIDPADAARQIFSLVGAPSSLRVSEITIQRSRY